MVASDDDRDDGHTLADLDALEVKALAALVRQAREGNTGAAKAALVEADRIRKTRIGELHCARMQELAGKPEELAEYLAGLGLGEAEVAERLGRKRLRPAERAAWLRGQDARLLEVRAIELGQMRRKGAIPKWAKGRS